MNHETQEYGQSIAAPDVLLILRATSLTSAGECLAGNDFCLESVPLTSAVLKLALMERSKSLAYA